MSKQPATIQLTDSQRELVAIFPTLSTAQQKVILTTMWDLTKNANRPNPLPVEYAEHADPALGVTFVSNGVLYLNMAAAMAASDEISNIEG